MRPNPSEICAVCKVGRLQARFSTHIATENTGTKTHNPALARLHELACSTCGLKYEPLSKGKTIKEILEDQLLTHTNATSLTCPCGENRLKQYWLSPAEGMSKVETHACPQCLLIIYTSETLPTLPVNPTKSLGKATLYRSARKS